MEIPQEVRDVMNGAGSPTWSPSTATAARRSPWSGSAWKGRECRRAPAPQSQSHEHRAGRAGGDLPGSGRKERQGLTEYAVLYGTARSRKAAGLAAAAPGRSVHWPGREVPAHGQPPVRLRHPDPGRPDRGRRPLDRPPCMSCEACIKQDLALAVHHSMGWRVAAKLQSPEIHQNRT